MAKNPSVEFLRRCESEVHDMHRVIEAWLSGAAEVRQLATTKTSRQAFVFAIHGSTPMAVALSAYVHHDDCMHTCMCVHTSHTCVCMHTPPARAHMRTSLHKRVQTCARMHAHFQVD